jgi:hypothetical protein
MLRWLRAASERSRMVGVVMTRSADRLGKKRGTSTARPASRFQGSLEEIIDSERRALRPIGTTARDVAERTGALLSDLLDCHDLWVFQGIRSATPGSPRIPHAISAGRQLILVESVAWPPGRYATSSTGQIYCDGTYIGQSAGPLLAALDHWQAVLSSGHQVNALVVVHPTVPGALALPASADGLSWSTACDAVRALMGLLPQGPQPTSLLMVGELFKAAAGDEPC